MIPRPLPIHSLADLPPLSWRDINYGYSRQLLGWRTTVELATRKVEEGDLSPLAVELASVGKDETWKIGDLLRDLSGGERSQEEGTVKKKWLYIVLNWLYQNRDRFEDPLQEVEVVYADFDYPDEISKFVRFIPSRDPHQAQLLSNEENIRRMYDSWREYLNSNRRRPENP